MIIEPHEDGLGFVIKAENSSDRALLTAFTRSQLYKTHIFMMKGSTYECDYSQATSFIFGWTLKPQIPSPLNVIDGEGWAEAAFNVNQK